ncbi:MAG: hypothetical protein KJ674_02435 [Nanoarchaeota archaeon]|nr:hypothetical protein [Nanoarchaeota archaeon]
MKKKKRKSNLLKNILIIALGLIIINIIYSFLVFEIVGFDMHLNVENRIGFNVTTGLNVTKSLEFGTSYAGGGSSKEIFIENIDYEKTKVIVKTYGDLKEWAVVSDNNFIMKQGDIKKLKVEVNIPSDAEHKEYYGKIKIIFMRF